MNHTEIQKQPDIIIKEIESLIDDNCTPIHDGIIDISHICKDVDSFLKVTISKFKEAIRQVENVFWELNFQKTKKAKSLFFFKH